MRRRLKRIGIYCTAAAIACIACSPARAQGMSASQTLEWYKNRGDYLVPTLRKEIRKGLSAADRQLDIQIQYDVIPTWNANAQAIRINHVPHIGIGAGLLAVIDWVSTAMAIDAEFHKRQCASAYITFLTDSILQNSKAASGKGSFAKSGSPFAFANSEPLLCSG